MKERPFGRRTRKIYYLLAAFNLLTIVVSAYLTFQLQLTGRTIQRMRS